MGLKANKTLSEFIGAYEEMDKALQKPRDKGILA